MPEAGGKANAVPSNSLEFLNNPSMQALMTQSETRERKDEISN